MEPLACRLRPKNFDDIVGQDHLVGKNGVIRKTKNIVVPRLSFLFVFIISVRLYCPTF